MLSGTECDCSNQDRGKVELSAGVLQSSSGGIRTGSRWNKYLAERKHCLLEGGVKKNAFIFRIGSEVREKLF